MNRINLRTRDEGNGCIRVFDEDNYPIGAIYTDHNLRASYTGRGAHPENFQDKSSGTGKGSFRSVSGALAWITQIEQNRRFMASIRRAT